MSIYFWHLYIISSHVGLIVSHLLVFAYFTRFSKISQLPFHLFVLDISIFTYVEFRSSIVYTTIELDNFDTNESGIFKMFLSTDVLLEEKI